MTDLLAVLRESLGDRYVVEREVGRGGMATVFLAVDRKHQRSVAVKVLHPELVGAHMAERFQREIGIAAQLQHPHILPLYDSGVAGEHLYYVMPFVEGESLRDRLTRERQLALEDAVRITVEVANALSYAHSHGVVHRDIKPENILLSAGTAVVADFGIARAVTSAGEANSLTQTGTVIGTPAYMSPEQVAGDPSIDGRSDQYSLACVLYEMLVGAPPFLGPTAQAVMARQSLDTVSRPSIVRATIPAQVEAALLRALNKVPADRYTTCALFGEALLRPGGATGESPAAARPPVAGRAWPGRRGLAIAGGALLAVAVVAFLILQPGGGGSRAGGPDPRHLAVLYFEDASADQSLGALADGLTDGLIHELSQVRELRVTSRNGVQPYRGTAVTPDSLARALRVGTLVTGRVAQSGDRLRVTVELVNATSGAEVGRRTLERPRGELFELQDTLAQEVAVFLRQRLGDEVRLRETRAGTRSVAAWELVQEAERVNQEVESVLSDSAAASRRLLEADSLLARAETMDRNWLRPIVQRGWLAYRRFDLAGSFDKTYYRAWVDRGIGHAERALLKRPADPEALELRGVLRYYQFILNLVPSQDEAERVQAAAEQDLRAAVAGNPRAAFAWTVLSHMLMGQSATAEAKLAALRAYEADPYLVTAKRTVWRLFQASLDLEDAVEAEHWCDEGQRRFAGDPRFIECELSQFALRGHPPDVPRTWRLAAEYEQAWSPAEREWRRRYGQMFVAMALVRAGLTDSARAVAARARAGADLDPTRDLEYLEAIVHNLLGDRDAALRHLSVYYATNPQLRAQLARDETWWFRNLRDDPRYRALGG